MKNEWVIELLNRLDDGRVVANEQLADCIRRLSAEVTVDNEKLIAVLRLFDTGCRAEIERDGCMCNGCQVRAVLLTVGPAKE